MKKLIFGILFLFLFVQCAYKSTCPTYDGIRTTEDWKRLHSNKKKSPQPYKHPTNKKQKSNEEK